MTPRPVLSLVMAALVLVSCSGSDTGSTDATSGTVLRVVIPDGNIRPEGAECAGARPFRDIHEGVDYILETGDGSVITEGVLPVGHAENADPSIDWGVERIPTVCVMELELEGLPERPGYQLRLPEGRPLAFDRSDLSGDEPLMLLVQ